MNFTIRIRKMPEADRDPGLVEFLYRDLCPGVHDYSLVEEFQAHDILPNNEGTWSFRENYVLGIGRRHSNHVIDHVRFTLRALRHFNPRDRIRIPEFRVAVNAPLPMPGVAVVQPEPMWIGVQDQVVAANIEEAFGQFDNEIEDGPVDFGEQEEGENF